MESTNRRWQNHLRAKGLVAFFMDRVAAHAKSSQWQHKHGSFHFPIDDRELDDALSQAYFEMNEHFPMELYLEITSRCNLNCIMCARSGLTRETGDMDLNLFKKIIDEVARENPLAYLHFYGIGDPLVDETLFEKLDYVQQKGLENTILFTNGKDLLKNDNYKKLAQTNIPTFGVDVDGFGQESYGQIRVGGDFDQLLKGILALKAEVDALPKYKRIELAYHVYPGINDAQEEMEAFANWSIEQELEYKFVSLHTWGDLRTDLPSSGVEEMDEPNSREAARTGPCGSLWGPMILSDGRVSPCFLDANGNGTMGSVLENTVQEIWQGAHRELRNGHVQGVFTGACKDCTTSSCVDLPRFHSRNYPDELQSGSK